MHSWGDALRALLFAGVLLVPVSAPIVLLLPEELAEQGFAAAVSGVLAIASVAVVGRRWGRRGLAALAGRPRRPGRVVASGAGLAVLWLVVETGFLGLVEGRVGPMPEGTVPDEWFTAGGLALLLVAFDLVLVTPVAEELWFRGLLFGGLRSRLGFWPAGLLSGLLFAAGHVDLGAPVLASLLIIVLPGLGFGLVCAALYDRHGLLAPIVFHATINGTAVIASQMIAP